MRDSVHRWMSIRTTREAMREVMSHGPADSPVEPLLVAAIAETVQNARDERAACYADPSQRATLRMTQLEFTVRMAVPTAGDVLLVTASWRMALDPRPCSACADAEASALGPPGAVPKE